MLYNDIRSRRDFSTFINKTNSLHDGYLVFVHYEHAGFEWGNPLYVDTQKTTLTLRIMVTSIYNTLIELVFEAVREWQIKEKQYDMVDTSISFTNDGYIIWCNDSSTSPEILRDADYVISKSMKWRIVSDDD